MRFEQLAIEYEAGRARKLVLRNIGCRSIGQSLCFRFIGQAPVEIGPAVEQTIVSVRVDGDGEWIEIGEVAGGTSELDLGTLDPNLKFSQVRLCSPTVSTGSTGRSAGPDIDAVAAINSVAP